MLTGPRQRYGRAMRRMHIGLRVADLDESIAFYSKLFGQQPTLRRDGYAKWMLDDPYVNFAVNTTGDDELGVTHLGFQVSSNEELDRTRAAWDDSGFTRDDQDDLVCGYQRQDKSWVFDPQALPIEIFVTHEVVDAYGTDEMPTPG